MDKPKYALCVAFTAAGDVISGDSNGNILLYEIGKMTGFCEILVDEGRFFMMCDASHFVGNKAEGRISKRVFQENKAGQIFRKTIIFYHLICTRVRG